MEDNHNMFHIHVCAKELLDSNLIKQLLTKYQILIKLPQISLFKKIVIFKV